MKKKITSPARAAAARVNGGKSRGPRDTTRTRWNATKHLLCAKTLGILVEGKHLPEFGDIICMRKALIAELENIAPPTVGDVMIVDQLIAAVWRLRRAFRYELSETEKDDPMAQRGLPNLLRYLALANGEFSALYDRYLAVRARLMKERAQADKLAQGQPVLPAAASDEEIDLETTTVATPCESAAVSADQHDGGGAEVSIEESGGERTAPQPNADANDAVTDAGPNSTTGSGET